jgi:hypothetical protein
MHHHGVATGPDTRPDREIELVTAAHSVHGRKHHRPTLWPSGRQFRATLAPATGEDRTACARAHTQPEAVRLGSAPVVRLKRPLAHQRLQIIKT